MTDQDEAVIAEVVAFWRSAGPERWFDKDDAFDRRFLGAFLERHLMAARRQLDHWLETAEGALALMVLLDQFPRNAFRGTAHMYATDALARTLADRALAAGHDEQIEPELRLFLYLPFAHSENPADQRRSVALAGQLGTTYAEHAARHHDIIARFGRFPHRNPILGRETTVEERAFLAGGGFAG